MKKPLNIFCLVVNRATVFGCFLPAVTLFIGTAALAAHQPSCEGWTLLRGACVSLYALLLRGQIWNPFSLRVEFIAHITQTLLDRLSKELLSP